MQHLHERDSSAKHLSAGKRCIQLCRQNKKGDEIIAAIEPRVNELAQKCTAWNKSKELRIEANDTVRLCDLMMDDELRTVHSKCETYDRANPGAGVTEMLFPGGNLSPLVTLSNKEEPQAVEQMISKIKTLENNHPLQETVEPLQEAVNNCNKALADLKKSVENTHNAKTEVDLAKLAIRRQYSASYFQAAGKYGKSYAERLFPVLHNSHTISEEEEALENEEAA